MSPSTTSTTPSPSGSDIGESLSGGPAPLSALNSGKGFSNGRLPFHISVTVGESYDDNIYIQPHKISDFITTLTARGELVFGDSSVSDGNYFRAFYEPQGVLYDRNTSEDAFNQNVDVFYQHRFSRLSLSLEQSYTKDQSTSAAVGNLVTADIYNTLARADYAYSDKFRLSADFTENFTDYQNAGYTSSDESVGDLYFLYNYDPKLSFGLGPRFGFLDVQAAPNQTYQQLLARVNYNYSGKLSFEADAGGEYREYQGDAHADTLAPVFDLSGTYQAGPDTTLSIAGARRYTPSYDLIGQDYISTTISLSVSQRFLEHFYARLSGGYENDQYQFDAAGLGGPEREDNYYFITPGLDWSPNGWLTVSAYYRYQEDDSNFSGSTFNDNQGGLSITGSY